MKKLTTYFSKGELTLWGSSAGLILISFFLFDRVNFMTLAASLIGTTSLIFNAKGNPIGQALMIVFSLLYGVISYTFSYFGEMITYLGMTGPMALFALISWLRNPYNGNHAEVAVNRLENKELAFLYVMTALVTWGFYFILDYFDTANMIPSKDKIIPAYGVYVARVSIQDEVYYGITNVGSKPTVEQDEAVGIETFLFDFNKDIYGESITVELLHHVRREQKFQSLEELKEQMHKDANFGKNYINSCFS